MTRKLTFATALLAATALVGCSGNGRDPDDGDGSDTDCVAKPSLCTATQQCNQTTKKCEAKPANDGTVGGNCTTPGEQSTCNAGNTCEEMTSAANMCSKSCSTANDCGMNGSIANVCAKSSTATTGFCVRGCDPAAANPCVRQDFACLNTSLGNICLPDCRLVGNECDYGYQCGQNSGGCEIVECAANGTCASGQVCWTVDAQTKVCVPDCTTAGCPGGMQCNSGTKICDPIPQADYAPCGNGIGGCTGNSICTTLDRTNYFCFPNCTSAACPNAGECLLQGTMGGQTVKACLPDCDGAACPNQWECIETQANGKVCDPSPAPPAGTRNPYEVCDSNNGCVAGATCIVAQSGATAGICLKQCAGAGDCTTPDTCSVQAGSSTYCARPCTTGGTACPTGTTCKNLGGTNNFCLP